MPEKIKIIHFEDEDSILNFYGQFFRDHDRFEYKHYYKPPAGKYELLELIILENPHLIITRIIMSEMNGFELTGILKSDDRTKHITIFGLDNLYQPEDLARIQEAGIDRYYVCTDCASSTFHTDVIQFFDENNLPYYQ